MKSRFGDHPALRQGRGRPLVRGRCDLCAALPERVGRRRRDRPGRLFPGQSGAQDQPGRLAEGHERIMTFLDQNMLQPRTAPLAFQPEDRRDERRRGSTTASSSSACSTTSRYAGKPYRYAYSAMSRAGLVPVPRSGQARPERADERTYEFGPEPLRQRGAFAPRIDAKDEDDGYLVSFVADMIETDPNACYDRRESCRGGAGVPDHPAGTDVQRDPRDLVPGRNHPRGSQAARRAVSGLRTTR
jgi:hypothetical protein